MDSHQIIVISLKRCGEQFLLFSRKQLLYLTHVIVIFKDKKSTI